MELHLIPLKKFRNIFLQVLIINIILIVLTFILFRNNIPLIPGYQAGKNLTNPLLIFIVLLAVIHTLQQRKHLTAISLIADFDTRLAQYEKFYRKRMLWYVLSVITSCLLCLLSQRDIFLYYSGADILLSLPFYPSAFLLKRELRTNDIILY
jgi:magnesium-transporting ATPase (P-type)